MAVLEGGKDSKRTFRTIVLLIKPFVWWCSRRRRRRQICYTPNNRVRRKKLKVTWAVQLYNSCGMAVKCFWLDRKEHIKKCCTAFLFFFFSIRRCFTRGSPPNQLKICIWFLHAQCFVFARHCWLCNACSCSCLWWNNFEVHAADKLCLLYSFIHSSPIKHSLESYLKKLDWRFQRETLTSQPLDSGRYFNLLEAQSSGLMNSMVQNSLPQNQIITGGLLLKKDACRIFQSLKKRVWCT